MDQLVQSVAGYAKAVSGPMSGSFKMIAKDMMTLKEDFTSFGHLSDKALAETSARMRSLGMDVKTLGKMVDKFLNFEDAAVSSAKLAQTFGMNIDAMKMMKAANKDPMKALDMMRKSFFAAGKDITNMTAAEKKLLEQTTGLTGQELQLAFAQKNRGRSMKDIKKKTESQADVQRSMRDAMVEMGDQMKKVVRP